MGSARRLGRFAFLSLLLGIAVPATAQTPRIVEISFATAKRVQLALWIEDAAGNFMRTVRLTEAVALRGIGNRPGALQMNSGFRWPYGRREGVLPVWAHRRASAPGAELFPFVIFQDRVSEGCASRTTEDSSPDNYFCLSFTDSNNDDLDAVSCASVFNSDKGRYMTASDVSSAYVEPFGGAGGSRALPLGSLYPPRRDLGTILSTYDHPDMLRFRDDTRRVMPEIDAVTMATIAENTTTTIAFDVPAAWPDGEYDIYLEANVEGDKNAAFDLGTPSSGAGGCATPTDWDSWSSYGYAYRGQPSVVYRVRIPISRSFAEASVTGPFAYGDLHGLTGAMSMMDGSITDDPIGTPGSGADRLRRDPFGSRLSATVLATAICSQPEPPPECFADCGPSLPCANGFVCTDDLQCVGLCDLPMPPSAIQGFSATPYPDEEESHHFAQLSFVAPATRRPIARYEVVHSVKPILTEDDFDGAEPAKQADLEPMGLRICQVDPMTRQSICPDPGTTVEVDVGQLTRETHYYFAIRAADVCNARGAFSTAEVTTTKIHFTMVSPCFVATAAYGTPLAEDIGVLRRFRDRHLRTSAAGRAFVDAYYALGAPAADWFRGRPGARGIVRNVIEVVVDWLGS